MPLQGTFDVLNFTEIMRLLGRLGVTGRLHLRSRTVTANLFFEEGSLVGADQSEHQAAAATGDVRSRLEEVCFELLETDRGTFEFQPGKRTSLPGAVRLKVDTVLTRARKRLEEWRVLVERVPSLDVHPRIVTDLDVTEVTLDKERWRMLVAIDGRRNLRAIGRVLNLSDFDACRILVDLLDAGVADLDEMTKAQAGNKDLVPTIPLPAGMAETAARPGDDGESVTVSRGPRPDDAGRPTDDAKRATTRATTVGHGNGRATPPNGTRLPANGTPPKATAPPASPPANGSSPNGTPADGTPADGHGDASARRRRARRRTPGGTRTEDAPATDATSATDGVQASTDGQVADGEAVNGKPFETPPAKPEPSDGAAAPQGDGDKAAEERRARRVVRIRSRAEPRSR